MPFYKIKNSLPPDTICLFEPRSFDSRAVKKKRIKSLLTHRREPDVLAKVLPFRPHAPANVDSFSHFERQVLIVRDPRDRLTSRLLYGIYDSDIWQRDDKVKAFLEILKKKEANPGSVPMKILLATFARLNGESFCFNEWADEHEHHSIRRPLDFYDGRRNLFLFKYEDMIDQRFESLERYLGVRLSAEASVPPELARVLRTGRYGSWRDWFTSEDVEYLRPVMQPFLDRYYPEADWELNQSPSIASEYSSRYVERIVNDRRASLKLPRFIS